MTDQNPSLMSWRVVGGHWVPLLLGCWDASHLLPREQRFHRELACRSANSLNSCMSIFTQWLSHAQQIGVGRWKCSKFGGDQIDNQSCLWPIVWFRDAAEPVRCMSKGTCCQAWPLEFRSCDYVVKGENQLLQAVFWHSQREHIQTSHETLHIPILHGQADLLHMWLMQLPKYLWWEWCHLEILINSSIRNLEFLFYTEPQSLLHHSEGPLMELKLPSIKFDVYLGDLESILSKRWIWMHDFNQGIDPFTCQQGYIYLNTKGL